MPKEKRKAFNPDFLGNIALLATLPVSLKMIDYSQNPFTQFWLWVPPLAYVGVSYGSALIYSIQKAKKEGSKPRSTVKKIQKNLNMETPPGYTAEETKIGVVSFGRLCSDYSTRWSPEKWAALAEKEQNPVYFFLSSLKHMGDTNYFSAMTSLRNAFDLLDGKMLKPSWSLKLYLQNLRFGSWLGRSLMPNEPFYHMMSAFTESLTNPERAWYYSELGRRVADHFESDDKLEMYLFHALLASAQRRSDEEQSWADALEYIAQTQKLNWSGETRNKIWRLSDTAGETLFVKGNSDREALLSECSATKTLESILEDDACAPRSLHVTDAPYDGYYAYAMRHIPGPTLSEKIKEGDTSSLPLVLKTLARIHARYPADGIARENMHQKIARKLETQYLAIPDDLKTTILANYRPVEQGATDDAFFAPNKDAHPENWIVGEKLGVIDCEITALTPVTFDLANLLAYQDGISPEETKKCVFKYASHLRAETGDASLYSSPEQLMRAYYNSVVHRVISLVVAWSEPGRERLFGERAPAINRALEAIYCLERQDPLYYHDHKRQYKTLAGALADLRTLVAS